jgi:uncharacterized cofD-like protein
VVAIGGGHGLATTLRAAARYAGEVTAVVSVADDGGSSRRLRDQYQLPAPGDLRRCLSALADPSIPLAGTLEHRFHGGELDGHALGNLLLAGLTETLGDLLAASDELGRLVGAAGRVIPTSLEPLALEADGDLGTVEGQVAIAGCPDVHTVRVSPADPATPQDVTEAIEAADQILIGPGSLFTSVLAACVVPAVRKALMAATGRRVYICNLAPQPGETAGYGPLDHLAALRRHGIPVDVVVLHEQHHGAGRTLTTGPGSPPVEVRAGPVATASGKAHDPERLSVILRDLQGSS